MKSTHPSDGPGSSGGTNGSSKFSESCCSCQVKEGHACTSSANAGKREVLRTLEYLIRISYCLVCCLACPASRLWTRRTPLCALADRVVSSRAVLTRCGSARVLATLRENRALAEELVPSGLAGSDASDAFLALVLAS